MADTETLVDEREDERADERQPGDERLPIQPAPQPSIVPRGTSAIQPPREAAPAIVAPAETAPPSVAGPPQPQPPVGTPAPAAEVQPNFINAPTRPPTQNMSPGQIALSNLSDIARQNPFSMLLAREKDIKNPFLRVLAKAGTVAGEGLEGMSRNYPAIQANRIRAAGEPGEAAQRAAQTQATQAETEQKEAQTARMKSGQLPIKNPIAIYSGNEQVGEEGYDENGQFHRNMFPGAGEAPAGPAGPQGPPARMPSAAQGGGGAAPVPAAAAPPARITTQKPQEPQRAPLPTPAEQAKLAPVGTEADRYNKEIQGVLGKEAADYAVKPTDSAEKAEKTLADARARATELEKGKSAERAANAPIAAQERKDARTMGYALDEDGNLSMMSRSDADKLHSVFEEMKPDAVTKDKQAIRQLDDVQINTSRYTKAAGDYDQAASTGKIDAKQFAADRANFHDLLNKAGIADFKLTGILEADLPLVSALSEGLSRAAKSESYKNLSPQGKDLFDGYLRTMSSIPAYQRALTGSARTNKESLDLELANIGNPTMDAQDILRKQNAFQENIDQVASGFPNNLPGIKLPKQVRSETETPKQSAAAPTQEPARPGNVPAGYVWTTNGPNGQSGWMKPKGK